MGRLAEQQSLKLKNCTHATTHPTPFIDETRKNDTRGDYGNSPRGTHGTQENRRSSAYARTLYLSKNNIKNTQFGKFRTAYDFRYPARPRDTVDELKFVGRQLIQIASIRPKSTDTTFAR